MIRKSRKPSIRFKGFTNAWEQRKLGDIGSVAMNRRIFKEQTTPAGDVPFYKIGTFGGEADAFISKQLFEEYKAKYPYPKIGDILVSASGSIGRFVEYKGEKAYFQDSNIIWLEHDDSVDKIFLKAFYAVVKWSGLEGSTIKRLYNKNILDTEIKLPSLKEQRRVGRFFEQLDNLITLHQRKYEKLKNIKKSLLQKMFPNDGENTPKIRFKGFTNTWEQHNIGRITNRYDNLRVPIAENLRVSGTTPYYGANGIQGYVKGFTHDGEFILIAEDGANDLKNYPVQYTTGKIWVNNHAHVLQAKEKLSDTLFLKYAFSQLDIESYLVGGSRAKLNANTLMELEIKTSENINEQSKIGSLFLNLDHLITLHQRKYEKLKNIKKSLLQRLFV